MGVEAGAGTGGGAAADVTPAAGDARGGVSSL